MAFALRLWGLADHSLWWDEGWSASLARKPVAEIIRFVAYDNHPPLHNLMLRGWWLLVGDGEFVMRYPSVLFGFLWVALAYRLGLMLGKLRTAQMGALLLAVSRFAIVWSQQVRMYTWSAMWATLVIVTALYFWRSKRWQILFIYVASAVAALLSLYLTVSSLITVNLVFVGLWLTLKKPRRLFIQWVVAQLCVMVMVMPWLLLNASQVETWTIFEPITFVEYLRLYASMLVVGNALDISATLPFTLVAVAIFVWSLLAVTIRLRETWKRAGLSVLFLGLLVQAVVVYAICFGIVPGFARPLVPRYLLLMSTGFYIIPGWGISITAKALWLRHRRNMALLAAGLFLVPQLIGLSTLYPGRVRRDDYVSISNALRSLRYPKDALMLYVDRDWPVFEAHYAGERYGVPYRMDLNEDSVDTFLTPLWYEHDAVWVVTTPEALQTDPSQLVPNWFQEHAITSETIINGENKLTLYIRTPERKDTDHKLAPGVVPVDTVPEVEALSNIDIPLEKYRTGDTIHCAITWAEQPLAGYRIEISGEGIHKMQIIEPLNNVAHSGYSYQLVDIYLDTSMPGGKYTIAVVDDSSQTVAHLQFVLIHAIAGLDIAMQQVPNPVSYTLGDSIHLIGYTLAEPIAKPGGTIDLTLYWRTDSSISSRYKVLAHILGETFNADSGNFLWGQLDNEPIRGQASTTLWSPGSVIVDPYRIIINPHAPPGTYTVEVGMYGLVDITRLPVSGPEGRVVDDAIHLVSFDITPP